MIKLLMKGLSNQEIGAKLFIDAPSIKYHMTNIFKLYGVKTRNQLILKVAGIEVD